jgi:hypothetical protein
MYKIINYIMKVIRPIPAVPRSRKFKYYTNSSEGRGGGSSTIVQSVAESKQEIIYVNTANDLPVPNDENYLLAIAADTKKVYIYDLNAGQWTLTTLDAVSKITAGSNISISPTTGIGNVTISSTAGNIGLNYSSDTTSNFDVLTDSTSVSGNTLNAKYKTLTGGTNVTLSSSGQYIYINSSASGGTYYADGTTTILSSTTFSGNRVRLGYAANSGSFNSSNVHPIEILLSTSASIAGGSGITFNVNTIFTSSNVFGITVLPFFQNQGISDAYGRYLNAVLSFNSSGNIIVTVWNTGTSSAVPTLACYVTFWTSINPQNIFPQ